MNHALSFDRRPGLPLSGRAARGAACHRSPDPIWSVPTGQVLRLPASTRARWVRLREGRLWLTADSRDPAAPASDWWLRPGESLHLAPGVSVLVEGWPSARFEMLEAPAA